MLLEALVSHINNFSIPLIYAPLNNDVELANLVKNSETL
jgi:hypothetical protein